MRGVVLLGESREGSSGIGSGLDGRWCACRWVYRIDYRREATREACACVVYCEPRCRGSCMIHPAIGRNQMNAQRYARRTACREPASGAHAGAIRPRLARVRQHGGGRTPYVPLNSTHCAARLQPQVQGGARGSPLPGMHLCNVLVLQHCEQQHSPTYHSQLPRTRWW